MKAGNAVVNNIIVTTIMKPYAQNGLSVNALRLKNEFLRQGLESQLITPFDAGALWLPVFAVRKLGLEQINRNWGMRWFVFWYTRALKHALAKHLRTNNVDVVMAQCPLTAYVALQLRQEMKGVYPVIMVKHFDGLLADEWLIRGMLTDEMTAQRYRELEQDVVERVDAVVYVSHWLKQSLEPRLGASPRASHVIWNGIDAAPIAPSGFDRSQLNMNDDDLMLVNIGVIDHIKNQRNLLDLFAIIHSHIPNAHLVLVGEGPDVDLVTRKAAELGIASHVHMTGRRNDVREILKKADLYIHFSRTESLGIVLLEAAQVGLPIAAVPVGGVTETLDALGGTVRISHDDNEGSYQSLERVLKDADLRRMYGDRNRRSFDAHFTIEVAAHKYLQIASELVSKQQLFQEPEEAGQSSCRE